MKFEYDDNAEEKECVAYIKCDMLVIKGDNGEAFQFGSIGKYKGVDSFDDWIDGCDHKFYPGDKITITF